MRTALLWLAGGACLGLGIALAATGGIGMPGADGALVPTAVRYSKLGYNGLDNLDITAQGVTAIALYITGIALMVTANAGAWKETNGY